MLKKFGIIGFGSIGQKHILTVRDVLPEASFMIFSNHASRAEIQDKGMIKADTIQNLVEWSPNVVMVSSEASLHNVFIDELTAIDATIVIEKPVAATCAQAKQIIHKSRCSDNAFIVAYNIRFSRALKIVKKILDSSSLGNVLSANVIVGQSLETWRPGREIQNTASASKMKGGGVLRELSHELDYLSHLFGQPNCVVGMTGTLNYKDLNVEDTAYMVLRYGSANDSILVSLNMDFVRQDKLRTCTIIGSEATLRWDLVRGYVSLHTKENEEEIVYSDSDDLSNTYHKMWKNIINTNISEFCDLKMAYQHLLVIETLESIQSKINDYGKIKVIR